MLRKELTKSRETEEMNVKPMRMYGTEENINYEDVDEGDLIIATIYQFNPPNTIYLRVGEIKAKMDLIDFYYSSVNNKNEKLIKSVLYSVGKRVLTRVKEKQDGQLILERSSVIKETVELLSHNIGAIIDATVETLSPFGIFVDIGNGFSSLVHPVEISRARIYDLEHHFQIGECIKVKIIGYNAQNGLVYISRKQAYEQLSENELPSGSIIMVECDDYVNELRDGVYVEYDPNNVGIMDIPENYEPEDFYSGRKVAVTIRHHKEVGFKASFVRFI